MKKRMEIFNRSGLSTVDKIEIPGTPKEIDTDYRGQHFRMFRKTEEKKLTQSRKVTK